MQAKKDNLRSGRARDGAGPRPARYGAAPIALDNCVSRAYTATEARPRTDYGSAAISFAGTGGGVRAERLDRC